MIWKNWREEGTGSQDVWRAVLNQTESSEKIDFVKRSETNVEEKERLRALFPRWFP